ncbi:MAG TPA: hypothetical protein DEB74_05995 [Lachnospiraceae bacterium]|nr:hypothetical protein [Lachnospiraceae bacterium]
MSLTVECFKNWSKRTNSTKIPDVEPYEVVEVSLKSSTSMISPVLHYYSSDAGRRVEWTYLHMPQLDAYFHVVDVVAMTANTWEITTAIDYLASYREYIADCVAYVEYSESEYDVNIVDTRYVSTTTIQSAQSVANTNLDVNGSIILLHAGGSQNTVGGMCGVTSFQLPLFSSLRDRLNALYQEEELSAQIKRIYNSPFDAFIGAYWIPVTNGTFGSSANVITLGDYLIGTGQAVTIRKSNLNIGSLSVPHIYGDFRDSSTFSSYYLFLPCIGIVELAADIMSGCDSIGIMGEIDYIGNIAYKVYINGSAYRVIGTYGTNCSISLPLSQTSIGNGESKVNSIFDIMKSGATMLTGLAFTTMNPIVGVTMQAAGIANGFRSVNNLFNAERETSVMTKGTLSGTGVVGLSSGEVSLTQVAHGCATNGVAPILGRPLMTIKRLGTLTGYVKTMGASVDCPCELNVRNAINQALDGGVYIE